MNEQTSAERRSDFVVACYDTVVCGGPLQLAANVNLNLHLFNRLMEWLYWLGYKLDTWRILFRFRTRCGTFFSFQKSRDRLWGPPSLLFSAHWGWLSTRDQGRKHYQPPPYTAALNHEWNYTPTPYHAFLSSTWLSCGITYVKYVTRRWNTPKLQLLAVLRYTAGQGN